MERIYMDNAATTRVTPQVLDAMMPYLTEVWGNPSSIHFFGRQAKRAIEAARQQVASAIGASPDEIFFTAGGTESDNWALRGAAMARRDRGRHIITSGIEHHAVLHTCRQLEKEGFTVTYLPVDKDGFVDCGALERAITPETTLISVMTANNEIGTLQPVDKIAAIAREKGILFHTDAVQAIGAIPVDVNAIGADLLSISGHKFHAPKGVGALYIRSRTRIDNFIQGGAQERGRRAGTENLASIVGMGEAIRLATDGIPEKSARVAGLRDRLKRGLIENIPGLQINGSLENRLPGNLNISIPPLGGEALLLNLDLKGIAASSGSACTSGSLDPSHVLTALGLSREAALGSVRFSLGDDNTEEEVDRVIETLTDIAERLMSMR